MHSNVTRVTLIFMLCCNLIALEMAYRASAQQPLHIVINEFDPFPASGLQWTELFNPTPNGVDISGWSIVTKGYLGPVMYTIPQGVVIAPQGYYVVEFSPYFLEVQDQLTLRDYSVSEVDKTPILTKPVNDGNAWVRYPNGMDTDSDSDWQLRPASKGYANSYVGPAITCFVSPPIVQVGSTFRAFGEIGPPRVTQVVVQMRSSLGDWFNLTAVTTTPAGTYSVTNVLTAIDTYQVRALLAGDAYSPPSFSSTTFVTVTKIVTGLSATVTHPSIALGRDIATYGQLTPAMEGINVTLTYHKPTGNPIVRFALTDAFGFYNDTAFKPSEAGAWNVTVDWQGNAIYFSTVSALQSFDVMAPAIPSFSGSEWIIGIIVGVVVGTIIMSLAVTQKTRTPRPPRRAIICPECRSPLLYDPTSRRWYCSNCRRYL